MAEEKKGSSVGAALAGLAIGAAVGAAAVVLSDEKKRKAIKSKVDHLAKEGSKKVKELSEKAEDFGEQARETITEKAEELQDRVSKAVHCAKKRGKRRIYPGI